MGQDELDARHGLRRGDVHRDDAGVGVRGAQHTQHQSAGELEVERVRLGAGDDTAGRGRVHRAAHGLCVHNPCVHNPCIHNPCVHNLCVHNLCVHNL